MAGRVWFVWLICFFVHLEKFLIGFQFFKSILIELDISSNEIPSIILYSFFNLAKSYESYLKEMFQDSRFIEKVLELFAKNDNPKVANNFTLILLKVIGLSVFYENIIEELIMKVVKNNMNLLQVLLQYIDINGWAVYRKEIYNFISNLYQCNNFVKSKLNELNVCELLAQMLYQETSYSVPFRLPHPFGWFNCDISPSPHTLRQSNFE